MKNVSSSFTACNAVQCAPNSAYNKKIFRSSPGESTITKQQVAHTCFSKGKLLDTVTLNYCSALGLIAVGVLPKPPLWNNFHQTSSSPAAKRPRTVWEPTVVTPPRTNVLHGEEARVTPFPSAKKVLFEKRSTTGGGSLFHRNMKCLICRFYQMMTTRGSSFLVGDEGLKISFPRNDTYLRMMKYEVPYT
jgi:hypothetical protein